MADRSSQQVQRAIARVFCRPFDLRRANCALGVADIMVALGCADPAADWRGLSQRETADRLVACGGVGPAVRAACARMGWQRVQQARPGDIGVAGELVSVHDGLRWWAKGRRGMVAVPAPDHVFRPI